MKYVFIVATILLFPTMGRSEVHYVPDHYPTIQDAIIASSEGDTIIVRDGTYLENVDFLGKSIILKSENGSATTKIDGGNNGSVVVIRDCQYYPSIEGFTITNGYANDGGGINLANCMPLVSRCFITDNRTKYSDPGGGIYCDCPMAAILDCTLTENKTGNALFGSGGYGGGIYIHSGYVRIENCVIENNITGEGSSIGVSGNASPGGHGGGIYTAETSQAEIINCIIRNNQTGRGGAGDSMAGQSPADGGSGGGIFCVNGLVDSCLVIGNRTGDRGYENDGRKGAADSKGLSEASGGGIYCTFSTIQNCAILNNTTGDGYGNGGGIYCGSGLQKVINCTIRANGTDKVDEEGGGLYGGPQVWVENSIFWDNFPDELNSLRSHVSYCNIQDGTGNIWFDPETCIDEDPLFEGGLPEEYHLTWRSPCINRGTPLLAPSHDIDGDARPYMGSIDMGADEYTGLHPLQADGFVLSASSGGQIHFAVDADSAMSGQYYVLLATRSGTIPGTDLPGGINYPLNWDGFTDLVVQYLNSPFLLNFLGQLDSAGQANPLFDVPGLPPVWVSETLHFAYTLDLPLGFVSNPVEITVIP